MRIAMGLGHLTRERIGPGLFEFIARGVVHHVKERAGFSSIQLQTPGRLDGTNAAQTAFAFQYKQQIVRASQTGTLRERAMGILLRGAEVCELRRRKSAVIREVVDDRLDNGHSIEHVSLLVMVYGR